MELRIALLEGDGIGPVVVHETVKVLQAVADCQGHQFLFDRCLLGSLAEKQQGRSVPIETIKAIATCDAILLGHLSEPVVDSGIGGLPNNLSVLQRLLRYMDSYACVREECAYHYMASLHMGVPYQGNGRMVVVGGLDNDAVDRPSGKVEPGPRGSDEQDFLIAKLAVKLMSCCGKRVSIMGKPGTETDFWGRVRDGILAREQQKQLELGDETIESLHESKSALSLFDVVVEEETSYAGSLQRVYAPGNDFFFRPTAYVGKSSSLFTGGYCGFERLDRPSRANPLGSVLSGAMMLEHLGLIAEGCLLRQAVKFCIENGFVSKDMDAENCYFAESMGDILVDYVKGLSGRP